MAKEYVHTIGRMAYMWGYAMVNSHNRRAAFAFVTNQNGKVPGWNGGVLPMVDAERLHQTRANIRHVPQPRWYLKKPNVLMLRHHALQSGA